MRNRTEEQHMTPKVEFHFDFGSPNAYFAHKVIPGIEQRTGAKFDYVPILLGGVFKLTNNQSPMVQFKDIKAKSDYMKIEIVRFIKKHGLAKFKMNPHFPVNTVQIMRGAVAAEMDGQLAEVCRRCVPPHVGGRAEDGRSRGDPHGARCRRARRRPHAGPHPGAGGQGQAAEEHRRLRLRAAPSARRPSSSARRFSSARTSCATSRMRSRPRKSRAEHRQARDWAARRQCAIARAHRRGPRGRRNQKVDMADEGGEPRRPGRGRGPFGKPCRIETPQSAAPASSLRLLLVCAHLLGRGVCRAGRGGRLAPLCADRQRARSRSSRAHAVCADGGADAGGRPRGRPVRPAQDRRHVPGDRGSGRRRTRGRYRDGMARSGHDLRTGGGKRIGARLRMADHGRTAAVARAARHAAGRNGLGDHRQPACADRRTGARRVPLCALADRRVRNAERAVHPCRPDDEPSCRRRRRFGARAAPRSRRCSPVSPSSIRGACCWGCCRSICSPCCLAARWRCCRSMRATS